MTKKEFSKIINQKIASCKQNADNKTFDFIDNQALRKMLIKSINEAVFVKNLADSLSINFSDAHPLNEIQILHYASIYEAIIDYILEKYFSSKIMDLLKRPKYIKHNINRNISIKEETISLELYSIKYEKRKLYDIQFEERVKKMIDLGIDITDIKEKLIQLYKFRNNIHILKASNKKIKFTKKSVKELFDESILRKFCSEIKRTLSLINNQT